MNLCIPIEADSGLESPVCAHFGSAPAFMIVEADSGSYRVLVNTNQHHGHGMCAPFQMLQGEQIDGMVVGGIGMGALNKLNAAGVAVYAAQHATVGAVVEAFRAGSLEVMQPRMACAGHEHEHEHS